MHQGIKRIIHLKHEIFCLHLLTLILFQILFINIIDKTLYYKYEVYVCLHVFHNYILFRNLFIYLFIYKTKDQNWSYTFNFLFQKIFIYFINYLFS